MHQFLQSTLLTFTYTLLNKQRKTQKNTLEKGYKMKMTVRAIIVGLYGQWIHVEGNALNYWGVINALLQQEEMVNVITCLYYIYVFEFTEFPRTGMCTTQNSSTNQGPRVRTLIHIMHTRHIMSSVLITGRNAQEEMGALRCPLYAARQHTFQISAN